MKIASDTFVQNQDMKKIFTAIYLLAAAFSAEAQKEGKVIYERTVQMTRRPEGLDPEIARQLPRSRTDHFELLFGNNQSLWRNIPKAEGSDHTISTGDGSVAVFRSVGSESIVYYDFSKGVRVDKREMFDNAFIVEDSLRKLNWKLSEETKTILGHVAKKATAQRIGTAFRTSMENGQMKREEVSDTSSIIAWYTTDFPVTTGPFEFQGQLPGLILSLDINNGRTIYNAVEISPKVSLSSIKEPKGGKKLSNAQYNKERERLLEEMRKNMPAGNTIRIQSN